MKRTMIIALLTVAAASVAFSQTSKPKGDEEERAKQTLMQLERDIGKANIDSDYATPQRTFRGRPRLRRGSRAGPTDTVGSVSRRVANTRSPQ